MKRKSNNKLAMLLIIVMFVLILMPSSISSAAINPKLNSSEKYLFLGREKSNEFQFKVSDTSKGWVYKWVSANTDVAKVNSKNGNVTATGVGKTKISVKITDSKGKKVKTLSSTVIVRDLIKKVAIKNPIETLKINQEYDYNRSFVTESGSTKKTSSITRWTVEQLGKEVDGSKATIDDKGIFVAKIAGEYEIVARVYQSKTKYNLWLKDPVKYAKYVNAINTTKVKVQSSLVSLVQASKSSIRAEFSADMRTSGIDKLNTIYRLYGDQEYSTGFEKVTGVKFDNTGRVVTISLNSNLDYNSTYRFKFAGISETIKPVKPDKTAIKNIRFTEQLIDVIVNDAQGLDLTKLIEAVDINGNVLFTGDEIADKLTFTYLGNNQNAYIYGNHLYMYVKGSAGMVKAHYNETVYDPANIRYDVIDLEAIGTVIGKTLDTTINSESISHQLNSSFAIPNVSIDTGWKNSFNAASGENLNVFTRYKTANNKEYQLADFRYESSNLDLALINGNTIYFANKGKVDIIVYDKSNTIVDFFEVIVLDSRRLQSVVSVDNTANITLSNSSEINDYIKLKYIAKDNLQMPMSGVISKVTIKNTPKLMAGEKAVSITSGVSNSSGEIELIANAIGAKAGLYEFDIEFKSDNETIKQLVRIFVVDADKDPKATSWRLEIPNQIDLKDDPNARVDINVYGYNSSGVKVDKLVFNTANKGYKLLVYKAGTLQSKGISGNMISAAELGAGIYSVVIQVQGNNHVSSRPDGFQLAATTLLINDSNVKEVQSINSLVKSGTTKEVISSAFRFALNGQVLDINTASQFSAVINGPTQIIGNNITPGQYRVETVTINNIEYLVNRTIITY
ncbi:MAG TPA: Ig-like domain-containing protein [Clostridiales bacterium]|nr:Ig-like domain-containing protein [Clostridiales bacterium]